MTQLRRVAIVGGNRIPFARSNTALSDPPASKACTT